MSERKYKVFFLTILSGILLTVGVFLYVNTGNFLWLIPGIIAYIVNVVYYSKKPARIVWNKEENSHEQKQKEKKE